MKEGTGGVSNVMMSLENKYTLRGMNPSEYFLSESCSPTMNEKDMEVG